VEPKRDVDSATASSSRRDLGILYCGIVYWLNAREGAKARVG
jgi:hypothetical protein